MRLAWLLLASKFLATSSPVASDWSPQIVVGVVILSLLVRASLAGCGSGDRQDDGLLVTVTLCVDLSAGVWLLIEFCRLSVMPRGGPPTSRLWRRLMASPVVGVTCSVASALSWLFNGGSLHTHTHAHARVYLEPAFIRKQFAKLKVPANFHRCWKWWKWAIDSTNFLFMSNWKYLFTAC